MNTLIFQKINSVAGHYYLLDKFMVFSSGWLGYLMILFLVILVLKNWRKFKDMFIVSIGSAIISRFFFAALIKYFYYHPRPYWILNNVNLLLAKETESSFPSGHVSFYFALAAGVYIYNRKMGWVFFVISALMGFARIYTGVHWPLDVLAGAGLGILVGLVGGYLYSLYRKKLAN